MSNSCDEFSWKFDRRVDTSAQKAIAHYQGEIEKWEKSRRDFPHLLQMKQMIQTAVNEYRQQFSEEMFAIFSQRVQEKVFLETADILRKKAEEGYKRLGWPE